MSNLNDEVIDSIDQMARIIKLEAKVTELTAKLGTARLEREAALQGRDEARKDMQRLERLWRKAKEGETDARI